MGCVSCANTSSHAYLDEVEKRKTLPRGAKLAGACHVEADERCSHGITPCREQREKEHQSIRDRKS
jgi:hypothetical protein